MEADSAAAVQTEHQDHDLLDLDLRDNAAILALLQQGQQRGVDAVTGVHAELGLAVDAAVGRLANDSGRLVLVGAGASGRLAVQDGAEMWPTYGWPHARLALVMAGGEAALTQSIEGVEDDANAAIDEVRAQGIGKDDVVLALAASGRSPWTCAWCRAAREAGALTIGIANNAGTPLLEAAEVPIWLDSGAEVLAGSTRMAAGTAQKVVLNLFSTLLMIRLHRTYGNLMVDMAAVNRKLDDRRLRMLRAVLPDIDEATAQRAIAEAGGWVKLAALLARGCEETAARQLLDAHRGSLRDALAAVAAGYDA